MQTKNEKTKNSFLHKTWNQISSSLLGTKFNNVEWETMLLFCQKFFFAQSLVWLNSFMSDFSNLNKNISFFKKQGGN